MPTWNARRKAKGLCLSCPNSIGKKSTVRCDDCHEAKLAKERGSGERHTRTILREIRMEREARARREANAGR